MIDIDRNNLGVSSSPYLRQHADNPVHWQEWSIEVLEYAKEHNKPLLVSVGYATCHWCHVMAQEAQFPAHSSLLFLLSYQGTYPDPELKKLLPTWLDNSAL
ncbi:MAG: thioredoxin domain-containing protein [Candidatus Cloacimonetes bacterium]|nr:thioredoxin domain-containing protein [Candidatus Cloacimonadota bacterium]